MGSAFGLFAIVVAMVLGTIWLYRQMLHVLHDGRLNLGLAGLVLRAEEPIRFWGLIAGLATLIVLLLLLAMSLLAKCVSLLA